MNADIVIPKNNESGFIDMAQRLGLDKVYFLYDFDEYSSNKVGEKLADFNNDNINIEIGFIVNYKNLKEASKHSKVLVAESSDQGRSFIETKKIKLIYGFENMARKDYLHQRASGLNHILCELARKNNTAIGFSYSSLFADNRQTASILAGRMMQNIALCQKYKVKTIIASFSSNPYRLRAHHDIACLFSLLGMDQKRVSESLNAGF